MTSATPRTRHTGLHGLGGALYLRNVQHARPLRCRLVAHPSCAVIEAEERGLAQVLIRGFAPPPRPLAHLLAFYDMPTCPPRAIKSMCTTAWPRSTTATVL